MGGIPLNPIAVKNYVVGNRVKIKPNILQNVNLSKFDNTTFYFTNQRKNTKYSSFALVSNRSIL